MNLFVALTDYEWYTYLSARADWEDVNFWQPGGNTQFRALMPGELLVFKLHAPHRAIVGGGFFAHWTRLPLSTAWEFFGQANGVATFADLRSRVGRILNEKNLRHDHQVGCKVLLKPFFLPKSLWIEPPRNWGRGIQTGKKYNVLEGVGKELFDAIWSVGMAIQDMPRPDPSIQGERFGKERLVRGRLGQGSFRVLVTDEYSRRCAITSERTLPALEAAHIRRYSDGGEHRINNGLLLRRDLHTLFDLGYLTVTPEYKVEVSTRIKEEFQNGRDYYRLHGNRLFLPTSKDSLPATEYLSWHNENKYLG